MVRKACWMKTILCAKCKFWFHQSCCNLSDDQFKFLGKVKKLNFICEQCCLIRRESLLETSELANAVAAERGRRWRIRRISLHQPSKLIASHGHTVHLTRSSSAPTISSCIIARVLLHTGACVNAVLLTYLLTYSLTYLLWYENDKT